MKRLRATAALMLAAIAISASAATASTGSVSAGGDTGVDSTAVSAVPQVPAVDRLPAAPGRSSASTYLFTPHGKYVHLWKNWSPDTEIWTKGGYRQSYLGSWGTYSHSSGVNLWRYEVYVDGHGYVQHWMGKTSGWGNYQEKLAEYFAVCDASGCSGWW